MLKGVLLLGEYQVESCGGQVLDDFRIWVSALGWESWGEKHRQGGLYILGNCSQELGVMGMWKWWSKVVYTGMEGTGLKSEEIKQCEIITILGKQGQGWGSADVDDWCNTVSIWPRVSQGCPQMRDDFGGHLRVWQWLKSLWVSSGFVGDGLGVVETMLKLDSCSGQLELVSIA